MTPKSHHFGCPGPGQRKSRKSRPSKKCPFSLKVYWKFATFSSRLDRGTRLVKISRAEPSPKIMKKYEKGTLKVDRCVSWFSRALATENDPKNHEKVWKKYLKSGPVHKLIQSSFRYRKWPQKSWKSMKKYEKSSSESGPVDRRIQSSFSYRKWPQKSWKKYEKVWKK